MRLSEYVTRCCSSEAHVSSFQLLEKCLALYGRVMLPKPAFNIRNSGGLLSAVLWAGRCGKRIYPRWWKVSWRILWNGGESCGEERFTSVCPGPSVSFASPDTGLTGILRESYDPRKELPSSLTPLSRLVGEESISSLPVIQINVISRLYSHPESRFHMSIYFRQAFFIFQVIPHRQFLRSFFCLCY